jgi:hypothetical protein
MLKPVITGAASALFLWCAAQAEPHSGLPVDLVAGKPPSPVSAAGQIRLVYELRLTNFSSGTLELAGLDVLDADTGRPLAAYADASLEKLLMPVGAAETEGKPRLIGGGRSVVVFVDLTLQPGAPVPRHLAHRLALRIRSNPTTVLDRALTGAPVTVASPAPVIAAPLRGARWVAANGLMAADHRRSFNAVDGAEHLAQRFAIDWVQLGADGRMLSGDPKSNASYHAYGAPVLAVADGRVSAVTDGLPENAGSNPAESRTVTLDTITGNSLVLDLGAGRFALYAHLQPGSLRVKPGDRVKAGQVLAKLGNSGNSDAPHLHFQLMDANSPLGAEGLPYALKAFTQAGVLDDVAMLDTGAPWTPKAATPPVARHGEFPVDNAVVTFP